MNQYRLGLEDEARRYYRALRTIPLDLAMKLMDEGYDVHALERFLENELQQEGWH